MLVHAGKYRTEDKLKTQTIHKLNTTQKKANKAKHSKTKLPWFSRLSQHSARKQGELILQCSRAYTGQNNLSLSNCIINPQSSCNHYSLAWYLNSPCWNHTLHLSTAVAPRMLLQLENVQPYSTQVETSKFTDVVQVWVRQQIHSQQMEMV